jgi:hypothetical protein
MDQDQYLLLFEKFLAGNATPQEVELIMSYRDQFEIEELKNLEHNEDYHEIEARLLKQLQADIGYIEPSRTGRSKWWMAAAAITILAAGAFFFTARQKNDTGINYVKNAVKKTNNIGPGSNKALLTLANGEKIALNDAANGTVIKQGDTKVQKKEGGILQYESSKDTSVDEVIGYNTVSTPKGGQYQIVLSDGTKVWLNSASSLKYPTTFVGNERRVELTGEGYFEVAKNKKMPFKVTSNGQQVEVLGTHFNIMAYGDEGETRTTLLEGSVKVSQGGFNRILTPGEQAVNQNDGNDFTVSHADIISVMAWKNGVFSLQNSGIHQIMRQIGRWYDVDVVYEGTLKDKIYGGSVSKSQNLTEILRNLELTGTIHFKVEGRRITVME